MIKDRYTHPPQRMPSAEEKKSVKGEVNIEYGMIYKDSSRDAEVAPEQILSTWVSIRNPRRAWHRATGRATRYPARREAESPIHLRSFS